MKSRLMAIAAVAVLMLAGCPETATETATDVAEARADAAQDLGEARRDANIVQLGGAPDFAPDSLTSRSHAEYVVGKSLVDMIKEDPVAERIAIDGYREMIQYSATWIRRPARSRC